MVMEYLLGIDLGTSSLKVLLIQSDGTVQASVSQNYQFTSLQNGDAEQDPHDWWEACVKAVRVLLKTTDVPPEEIRGISFSGQMHGVVILDENHEVVRSAILHCDARTSKQVQFIKETLGKEQIGELVMNPIYAGFLLPSLLWIRDNEPDNFKKIRYVMLPKDYLKFRLTGIICSDYSDASATLVFDIKENKWSTKIMKIFQLPEEWFPDCYETMAVIGEVTSQAASEMGLCKLTKVVNGGGDQVMQGIGNGITKVGEASVNIGTSGQVSFQSDHPILNPTFSTNTFCGYEKGRWITMGAIMNAGLSLRWFNNILGNIDYQTINEEVASIQPGSGGVIFLPYLNGERTPHLNPNISGEFIGLNLNTTRAHMLRAIMEGVAYALNQCMEVCKDLGLRADYMVASGGGAKSEPWLQIQADIFGIPLKIADTDEQASLGAAIVAGVGVGIYKDIQEGCEKVVCYKEGVVEPNMKNHKIYCEYYKAYKEAYVDGVEILESVTRLGRR